MASSAQQKRILVIDDVRLYAKTLASALRNAGYFTAYTDAGRTALTLLTQQPFDAVIADVKMPDLSGPLLLLEVKKRHKIPVILISGFGQAELGITDKSGAYAFLSKPVRMEELQPILQKLFADQDAKQDTLKKAAA